MSFSPYADISAEAWMADAACVGYPYPDVFFPEQVRGRARKTGTDRSATAREALRICAGCSVKTECLRFALDKEDIKGVWGGSTTEQRNQARTLRRRSIR